jgi:FkbM family methyltransferase
MPGSLSDGIRAFVRRHGLAKYIRPHQTIAGAMRRRYYEKHKPAEVELECDGLKITVAGISEASDYALIKSDKDHHLVRFFLNALKDGGVFWDIGANIGVYSLFMGKLMKDTGSVVSFEPEPRSRGFLQSNVTRMGLTNVRVVPAALSSSSGKMSMNIAYSAAAGYHSLVAEGAETAANSGTIQVDVLTGDEAVTRDQLPTPTAIKIDVEGFELDVLKGMPSCLKNPSLKAVLIEVHFAALAGRNMPRAHYEIEELLVGSGLSMIKWLDRSHITARRP